MNEDRQHSALLELLSTGATLEEHNHGDGASHCITTGNEWTCPAHWLRSWYASDRFGAAARVARSICGLP